MDSVIDQQSVGFAGSVTLDQIGIYDRLIKHNKVYWHHRAGKGMSIDELRKKASTADIYLSSVNAVSQNGEIVNIDGTCNRVASIFYGHKKVYLVIGMNKIEADYEHALYRARNIAAPKNAKRLGVDTLVRSRRTAVMIVKVRSVSAEVWQCYGKNRCLVNMKSY